MIGLGMGGWMADFGEYLPIDAVLYSGEDPAIIHNQWPAIWAKMNQEAVAECGKKVRYSSLPEQDIPERSHIPI